MLLAAFLYGLTSFLAMDRQAHRDEARPAGAIVVFGAAEYNGRPSPVLRDRLEHALALYRRGLAPLIITTGGAGGEWRFTEAGVGRNYLLARGVPPAAVLADRGGYSTPDSVARVAALLHARGLRAVIAVSDGYHIYRLQRLLAARGIVAYGSPRPGPESGWRFDWRLCRQVVALALWRCGFNV